MIRIDAAMCPGRADIRPRFLSPLGSSLLALLSWLSSLASPLSSLFSVRHYARQRRCDAHEGATGQTVGNILQV
jgi:hypothetical protein